MKTRGMLTVFAALMLAAGVLSALVLPNGMDVPVVKAWTNENGVIGTADLKKEIEVETPLGKYTADHLGFFDDGVLQAWSGRKPQKAVIPLVVNSPSMEFMVTGMIFYNSGALFQLTPEPGTVLKLPCGEFKPYWIYFNEDGSLKSVFTKTLHALETKAGRLEVKSTIGFYPDGSLYSCFPDKPAEADTPAGRHRIKGLVMFSPGGSLTYFTLDDGVTVKVDTSCGRFRFSESLYYHDSGAFKGGHLAEAQDFRTPWGALNIYNTVFFHENGVISYCELGEPALVQTPLGKQKLAHFECYPNTNFSRISLYGGAAVKTPSGKLTVNSADFYADGTISSAAFHEPVSLLTPLGKIKVNSIGWYRDGKVKTIGFPEDTEVKTPSGKITALSATFLPNGSISSVIIRKDMKIGGRRYSQDSAVGWDEKGDFLGSFGWDEKELIYVKGPDGARKK